MSLIQISNLTFCHGGSVEPVFRDLSLQLDTSWRLGLVGRNGRGKTTFLRLLAGAYEYSGTISADMEFDYFPLRVSDTSEAALLAAERLSGGAPLWRLRRELSLLEVPEEVLARPFALLSGGEQTKVLLAALFLREGRFPLIDEPTDHLDARGRAAVSRYLGGKKGFILVSHDRAFLDGCVDHILAMSRESVRVEKGDFSSWCRNKTLRDAFEAGENEKLKKEIGRLREAARRASSWSDRAEGSKFRETASGLKPDRGYLGHKAAKMMKRSKGIEARRAAAEEEKSALLRDVERPRPLKLTPLEYGGGALLSLRGVSVSYGGAAVCPPVSFRRDKNDRIALCEAGLRGGPRPHRRGEAGRRRYDFLRAPGHLLSRREPRRFRLGPRAGREPVQSDPAQDGFQPFPVRPGHALLQPRPEEKGPFGREPQLPGPSVHLGRTAQLHRHFLPHAARGASAKLPLPHALRGA